jgi:hypothetical protein
LDLFEGPLADVRFPDVDRESLHAAEIEVEQRRAELQRALEAVQLARAELEDAHATLFDQARRAHAYATIYAEADDELRAALAGITLEQREPAPKKRGRPAKGKGKQASLSVAEDAA